MQTKCKGLCAEVFLHITKSQMECALMAKVRALKNKVAGLEANVFMLEKRCNELEDIPCIKDKEAVAVACQKNAL